MGRATLAGMQQPVTRDEVYDADGDPLPLVHDDWPGACPVCDARREAWLAWFDSEES